MGLVALTTSTNPVLLSDAKTHLRILNDDNNDAALQVYLDAAFEFVQTETRQQFCNRTYTMTMDGFHRYHHQRREWDRDELLLTGEYWNRHENHREIILPLPPLVSVSSIAYTDPTGTPQVMPSGTYVVDPSSMPGRIALPPNQSWPETNHAPDCVNITFTAGYGADGSSVPTILKQAILLLTGGWYENRESQIDRQVNTIPMGVQCIVDQQKFPIAHSA